MENENLLRKVKTKKIGALLKDARLASARNTMECAQLLSITQESYLQFENGITTPSIPQLEAISIYLDISLDHFRGSTSKHEALQTGYRKNLNKIILVRDRIIGANIRKARIENALSTDELSTKTGIDQATLEAYELGKKPVPITDLEIISSFLEQTLDSYMDHFEEQISEKNIQIKITQFLDLPEALQEFVTKPVNKPFLELAYKLSDLPVDRLRSVAEGLLEITY
ncbi:MAG: helix-turn-helix transcriptional regulator [Anaerolineaceae bacterium]|nr:helix-turn-helix transcriptional regulator [Anaerolineaceae bacterium]